MPKRASLRQRKHPGREKRGRAAWCVTLPKELRGRGEKENNFFKTEREAKEFSEKLEAKLVNYGRSSLTSAQEIEARACYDILIPGFSLRETVDAGKAYILERSKGVAALSMG